jgi:hypothetical protein
MYSQTVEPTSPAGTDVGRRREFGTDRDRSLSTPGFKLQNRGPRVSNPSAPAMLESPGPLAQLAERRADNAEVRGSSPRRPTTAAVRQPALPEADAAGSEPSRDSSEHRVRANIDLLTGTRLYVVKETGCGPRPQQQMVVAHPANERVPITEANSRTGWCRKRLFPAVRPRHEATVARIACDVVASRLEAAINATQAQVGLLTRPVRERHRNRSDRGRSQPVPFGAQDASRCAKPHSRQAATEGGLSLACGAVGDVNDGPGKVRVGDQTAAATVSVRIRTDRDNQIRSMPADRPFGNGG